MKIVVLDGYAANPGDLSWEAFERFGDVTVHERTLKDKVLERSHGAEILLTNKTVLDRATINALPELRYVGVLATGYNVVDIDAAREAGVVVTNVPAYSTPSVVQATFALILELTSKVGLHDTGVHRGKWTRSADFSYTEASLVELSGLTIGIVGLGAIGGAVAKVALAFGMKVLAHTNSPKSVEGVQFVDLDTLLRESDVVTLHCPLTDATRNLINDQTLSLMKPRAFVINAARGPIVDEAALARALNDGRIAGAGLDVLSTEPPKADNPLLSAKNCIITPHVAWATKAARKRLLDVAADNVRAFLAGRPTNVIGA
jgi:glycerate dehydrogenase